MTEWRHTNPIQAAATRRAHYEQHKQELNTKRRTYRTSNKERTHTQWLKRVYGVTLAWYNEKRREQNFACAICHSPETEMKRRLAVDHDHITGRVRGLLCVRCNTTLETIEQNFSCALEYIKTYESI